MLRKDLRVIFPFLAEGVLNVFGEIPRGKIPLRRTHRPPHLGGIFLRVGQDDHIVQHGITAIADLHRAPLQEHVGPAPQVPQDRKLPDVVGGTGFKGV